MEKPNESIEKRVRALKKRLTFDFNPLRDTLSKGLEVIVDREAAVLITSTVEAFCECLFNVIIKNLHDESVANLTPLDTKVTVTHIQVALRTNPDFSRLLTNIDSISIVLEYFLDDATSKALYDRSLIATREAKHLRVLDEDNEEEMIRIHERTRNEWQKREDDPFTEVDFAMVLKCVHPAFTLSYNATMVLSAIIRELLNEVCTITNLDSIQARLPPELLLQDIEAPLFDVFHGGEMGKQVQKNAYDCLERFRLKSRKGNTLTLRFRPFPSQQNRVVSHTLGNIPRELPFNQILPQICKKLFVEPNTMVLIYRGHQVEPQMNAAILSIPTGAFLYIVSRKWWDHTRRNEARRGLLNSLRPQDAYVKSLAESTESKVKSTFHQNEKYDPHQYTSTHATSAGAGGATGSGSGSIPPVGQTGVAGVNTFGHPPMAPPSILSNAGKVHAGNIARDGSLDGKKHMLKASIGTTGGSSKNAVGTKSGSASPLHKQHQQPVVNKGSLSERERSQESISSFHEDSLTLFVNEKKKHGTGVGTGNSSPRSSSTDKGNSSPLPPPNNQTKISARSFEEKVTALKNFKGKSDQLMSTLDEAWLGFAGISGGVRAMREKVTKFQEQENVEKKDWLELETEITQRLEKAHELVQQTVQTKDFLAELLQETRKATTIIPSITETTIGEQSGP